MTIDINLIVRSKGDSTSSTLVKNAELTWDELDQNFLNIKTAIASAVALIPATTTTAAPLSGTGYGSAVLVDRVVSYGGQGAAGILTADKDMITWSGNRGYGHLNGNGIDSVSTPNSIKFPRSVASYGYIVDCGINGSMAYALFNNGDLYTWGINSYGQLGTGDTTHRLTPVLVAQNVEKVYAQKNAGYHVDYSMIFIKKTDGYLYGCGYNGYGKLGMGNTNNYSTFTKIPGVGTGFKKVWNLGRHLGCLIVQKADGTIWASGYNGYGQLGNASTTNQLALLEITNFWGGIDASDDIEFHGAFGYDGAGNCFLMMTKNTNAGDSEVWTCGNNTWGQLGDGTFTQKSTPSRVLNFTGQKIKKAFAFGGGPSTQYVLLENGDFYNWGYNGLYQIGNGNTNNKASPGAAITINGQKITDMWSSEDCHSNSHYATGFVKTVNNEIYSAGYNGYGQLGCGNNATQTGWSRVLTGPHTITWMGRINGTNNGFVMGALTSEKKLLVWGYASSYEANPYVTYPGSICTPREVTWL